MSDGPDLLDRLELLQMQATWRGVAVQRRGGAERALRRMPARIARELARELKGTPPGFAVMVHTPTCRRRDEHCRCGGLRLVAGPRA